MPSQSNAVATPTAPMTRKFGRGKWSPWMACVVVLAATVLEAALAWAGGGVGRRAAG